MGPWSEKEIDEHGDDERFNDRAKMNQCENQNGEENRTM
jgi:hypothetical protein